MVALVVVAQPVLRPGQPARLSAVGLLSPCCEVVATDTWQTVKVDLRVPVLCTLGMTSPKSVCTRKNSKVTLVKNWYQFWVGREESLGSGRWDERALSILAREDRSSALPRTPRRAGLTVGLSLPSSSTPGWHHLNGTFLHQHSNST